MAIRRILFSPAGCAAEGLEGGEIRDLRRVVVLAGPNGSGKSRYLRVARLTVEIEPSFGRNASDQIDRLRAQGREEGDEIEGLREQLAGLGNADLDGTNNAIQFVTDIKAEQVEDPGVLRRGNLVQLYQQPSTLQAAYTKQWLIAAGVAETLFDERHPDVEQNIIVPRRAYAQALNQILETTFGRSIDWDRSSHGAREPTFGQRRLKPAELSPGERILFAWCALLARGRVAGDSTILMLDEPELHLHPAVCVDILERVVHVLEEDGGQLWLATHSPAIVARFHDQSLYWVEDGKISHASRLDEVLDGLLGGPDARRAFVDLLGDAEGVELLRFAVQCLIPPGVAGAREADPQQRQFVDLVQSRVQPGSSLRVLDYGSGRGRFAAALEGTAGIDYFAYNDPRHDEHHAECVAHVQRLHEDADRRVTTEISDFRDPMRKVHVVVMCNFLHEVPVEDWRAQFETVDSVLADGGFLVLMEDQQIRVGELAHRGGFLILSLGETRTLFGEGADIESLTGDTRLSLIAVPKARLSGFTRERLIAALRQLQERALDDVRSIRDSRDGDHRTGRRHALAAMLHTNASLALHQLGDDPHGDRAV